MDFHGPTWPRSRGEEARSSRGGESKHRRRARQELSFLQRTKEQCLFCWWTMSRGSRRAGGAPVTPGKGSALRPSRGRTLAGSWCRCVKRYTGLGGASFLFAFVWF